MLSRITVVALLLMILVAAHAAPAASNAGVLPLVHGYYTGQGVVVPLRGVAEWLGATVGFASPRITVSLGAHNAILTLNSKRAVVNGKPVTLASPARTYGTITCVPLRFVAESLGAKVAYEAANSDKLVPLPCVVLSLGDRTGRVIVHSEPPNVVAGVIADLQKQIDGWKAGAYGKDWIISIVKVSGSRAKVSGPAWWAGLGKDAAFSKTEMSDLDLSRKGGHWRLPKGH